MHPVSRYIVAAVAALGFSAAMPQDVEPDTVSAASPYAHADMSALADGKHDEWVARWRDELNLSPEQQAIMAEILMDYGTRLRPLFERGANTVWSIMNVAPKDPDYSLDTEQAAQAAAETAAEVVRVVSEMRSAIHSIMTAEQMAAMDSLIEAQRQQWRERAAEREAERASETELETAE